MKRDIESISERLSNLEQSTSKKQNQLLALDKCLYETENAYHKIIESSNVLLGVLNRERQSLET